MRIQMVRIVQAAVTLPTRDHINAPMRLIMFDVADFVEAAVGVGGVGVVVHDSRIVAG